MLQDGMTYNTNECYKNVIDCEMNVFANMLEIMHLWNKDYYKFGHRIIYFIKIYILMYGINNGMLNCTNVDLSNEDFSEMDLTYIYLINANLNKANLNEVNLTISDLSGISLVGTSLVGTSLTRSHLKGADLKGADLRMADLRMADLKGACLTGADLTGACLDEKQINYLKQSYDLKDTRVYIAETGEIISYDEYCERKH